MQKASGHRAHLNFVSNERLKVAGLRFKVFNHLQLSTFDLELVWLKGQMSPAPTHCMQSVSGSISLP